MSHNDDDYDDDDDDGSDDCPTPRRSLTLDHEIDAGSCADAS